VSGDVLRRVREHAGLLWWPPQDLTADQVGTWSCERLRRLPTEELLKFKAGWETKTVQRQAAEHELALRVRAPADLRAWLALLISLLALAVSVTSCLVQRGG